MSKISLRKRSDIDSDRYQVDFSWQHPVSGERHRFKRMSPHTSKKRARRWARNHLNRLTDPNWHRKQEEEEESPLFSDVFDEFIEKHVKPNLAASTLSRYSGRGENYLKPFFKGRRVADINQADTVDLVADLRSKDLASKTIRNITGLLSSCLSFAQKMGHIKEKPVIENPKVEQPEIKFLTPDEIATFLEAAEPPIYGMAFLAMQTGMRAGEIFAVHWEDIDFDWNRIRICRNYVEQKMGVPKSRKGRMVPMTNTLREYLHPRSEKKGFVFHDDEGVPYHYHRVSNRLKRTFERAGLDEYGGWHIFRHSYAARLATEGIPLRTIQKLLGHSTITMTERYAHLMPDALTAALGPLEGFGVSDP